MSGNRAERRRAAQTPGPSASLDERYGRRGERRALLPAIVAAVVLLAGLVFIGQDGFVLIRYAVAVLALISAVFMWQARRWEWLPVPAVIAVLWNPVLPFPFAGQPFRLGHVAAAAALLVAGLLARSRPAR